MKKPVKAYLWAYKSLPLSVTIRDLITQENVIRWLQCDEFVT